jgi:hypothetical protein
MNFKTTFILLLVCAALFAVVKLIPGGSENGNGRLHPAAPLVEPFAEDDVVRIDLKRPAGDVAVVRRDGAWKVVLGEREVPADEVRVRSILDAVANAVPETLLNETEVDQDKLASFELDPVRIAIRLTLASGGQREIRLGAVYKRGLIYVAGDGKVAIASDSLQYSALPPLHRLRDRNPVGLHDFDVETVEVLEGEREFLAATLDPESLEWSVRIGERVVRGDSEAIGALVLAATDDLEVSSFEDDEGADRARYGLDRPRFTVEILPRGGGASRVVLVGEDVTDDDVGFYWAIRGEPSVYRTNAASSSDERPGLLMALMRPRDEYRSRSLLHLGATSTARSLRLVSGGRTLGLERSETENAWRIREPEGLGEADAESVAAFIRQLRMLRVTAFADAVTLEDAGLGESVPRTARLEIRLDEGEAPLSFEVGRVLEEGGAYVRRGDEPTVVVAPPDLLEALRSPWWRFRSRRILEFSLLDVVAIESVRGDTSEKLRREGNAWALPEGAVGENATDLVGMMSRLEADARAERPFVAATTEETDLAAFGLDPAAARIRLTLKGEGGERVVELAVGRTSADAPVHAVVTGTGTEGLDGLIFVLPEEALEFWTIPLVKTE